MIKISYIGKIFLIRQPENLETLKNIFKTKFKLNSIEKFNFSFIDINNDEISIENDEDLLCAYSCSEKNNLKILLNKDIILEKKLTEENMIDQKCLKLYSKFLKKKLPEIDNELEEKLDNNLMPCKYCYFKSDLKIDDSFDDSLDCAYCKNQKYRPISNNIKMLLHVANSKIKKYLLDPINFIKNKKIKKETEKVKKEEKPIDKIFIKSDEFKLNKSSEKIKLKKDSISSKTTVPHLIFKQTKKKDSSLISELPHKSAICFKKNFEKKTEQFDEKLIIPKNNEFPEPPTPRELKFSIVDSSAIFDCRKIDVKLVIANKNDFDWPPVSIYGGWSNNNPLDIKIADKIKTGKGKVKAIKFSCPAKSTDIKNLEFYFYHYDKENNIYYVSKRFNIKISKEESCFIFKLCDFIK